MWFGWVPDVIPRGPSGQNSVFTHMQHDRKVCDSGSYYGRDHCPSTKGLMAFIWWLRESFLNNWWVRGTKTLTALILSDSNPTTRHACTHGSKHGCSGSESLIRSPNPTLKAHVYTAQLYKSSKKTICGPSIAPSSRSLNVRTHTRRTPNV